MIPRLRSPRARLLARLVLYGAAIVVGLPVAFSQALVRPAHVPLPPAPTPARYEEERVFSEGFRLRAWTLRGGTERPAAVVVHGVGDSLESLTGIAEHLNRPWSHRSPAGHEGSRSQRRQPHHPRRPGEGGRPGSDAASQESWPWKGRLRAHGCLDGRRCRAPGGGSRARYESRHPRGPFDNYRETIAHHAHLYFKLPRWLPLIPLTIAVAEWRAGDADDVDAVKAAGAFRGTLLAIADGGDDRMPPEVVRRVFDAHRGPKAFWIAPQAPQAGASLDPGYFPRIEAFLGEQGL